MFVGLPCKHRVERRQCDRLLAANRVADRRSRHRAACDAIGASIVASITVGQPCSQRCVECACLRVCRRERRDIRACHQRRFLIGEMCAFPRKPPTTNAGGEIFERFSRQGHGDFKE